MHACIREEYPLACLGGDECAVIMLSASTPAEALAPAARLVMIVSEPYSIGEHIVRIGLSIGIASAPEDAETAEHLQVWADQALYAAKNAGGGTVRLYGKSLAA